MLIGSICRTKFEARDETHQEEKWYNYGFPYLFCETSSSAKCHPGRFKNNSGGKMNNNIRIAGQANSNDLILDVKNTFLATMLVVVPEGPLEGKL